MRALAGAEIIGCSSRPTIPPLCEPRPTATAYVPLAIAGAGIAADEFHELRRSKRPAVGVWLLTRLATDAAISWAIRCARISCQSSCRNSAARVSPTCEKILAAARKAIRAQQDGNQVVMVVSAMGKNTDMLVRPGPGRSAIEPPAREMDMLLSTGEQVSVALMAMAIDPLGSPGVSLTGAQIGIRTDSTHTKARIQSISTDRMQQAAGRRQHRHRRRVSGDRRDFNITTLGRGGSDTTAVALAAVLRADACEIYTDVDGVYTTDPRLLPEARRVSQISYDEMLELASLGAGVMHSRSIEFAKKF